jgi:hypothetical protein
MREPRTMLEVLKDDRGLTWREVARAIERAGMPISADHARRLGTGSLSGAPKPGLARAMERAFGLSIGALLGLPAHLPGCPRTVRFNSDSEALFMAAEKMRRLGINLPRIDDYTLFEGEVRELARAYPVRPLTEIINPLVTLQEAMTEAIVHPPRPGDGGQLYGLAAITAGMLAKASHDIGDTRAATAQLRTAILLADQVDRPELVAWLSGVMSLVCYWDGRPRDSLRYVGRGLDAVRDTTGALWLHAAAARSWARLGNADQAAASVAAAMRTADTMRPTDLDGYGGMLTFTRARATYYMADAFAWLPGHQGAESAAVEAVAAFSNGDAEDWAFGDAAGAACALGIVRIGAGDVAGAEDAMLAVFDLPREQRIGGVMKSVQRVADALTRAAESVERTALQVKLELFARAPLVLQP